MLITSQITLQLCYGVRAQSLLDSTGTVLQGLPKLPETAFSADLTMLRPVVHPRLAIGCVLASPNPTQPQPQTIYTCFQDSLSKVDSQVSPRLLEIVGIVLLGEQHSCVPYPTSRALEG